MILQALTAYYEQLLQQGKISAPGWDDTFKVSYELRLNDAGQLLQVIDLRTSVEKGKKTVLVPREIRVPKHEKRTVGIIANLLCDNSTYLLGADEKGKPARSVECFKACAALHHTILDGADSPAARAVLAYFDHWDPAQAAVHPLLAPIWKEITGNANLIFGYEAADHSHLLVNEDPVIQAAWQAYYDAPPADTAQPVQCLVTGKEAPAALLHPSIMGVAGAQSYGASLVSFNAPSFCSFGHEQGQNAPVSEYAAFAYTTALNRLLADRDHCQHVGDTTLVCWAENAEAVYQDAMSIFLFGADEAHGLQEDDVKTALKRLAAGQTVPFLESDLAPDQHFYLLGLAPNAARLSVRFFLRDTFGSFARNLRAHADALEIIRPSYDKRENLSIWALTMETVNRKERNPAPAPQLTGDLLRAVLTGGRYPATLLNGVTQRIRAEQNVTRGRAAILKAYYLRNELYNEHLKEVLTVKLNDESCYLPYVLGRLFAVLEAIQDAANPNINTTIRERYFNSACATPAMVFPTLVNLAQKHLNKLNSKQEIYYNNLLIDLIGRMDEPYPVHLNLPEQGAFQIGYYHQQQKRFTKNEEE